MAWVVTGIAVVAAVLAFLWRGNAQPTVPDMGNAGKMGSGPLGRMN